MEDLGKMESNIKIFNTPLEIGLRCLALLSNDKFTRLDSESILYLDYFILNTSDINGPSSIHAPIPNRRLQVFSKKKLIEQGLKFMLAKGLISVSAENSGFEYFITAEGKSFLQYFQSEYYQNLIHRIEWVAEHFGDFSNVDLRNFISTNLDKWGIEVEIGE